MTTRVPVLVVGAGLSGLVCAHTLRKGGVDALTVEASARPGGVIRSERRDGYLLEYGPQSFNATSIVLDLCRELRIDSKLVQAPAHAPRFVLVSGALRPVPLTPPAFLTSPLFSLATKVKVLRDVFEPGDVWVRTGDLMRKDEQGYFYFVDRVGDTFRWKGENVATSEVSEAISTYPGVKHANVYGVSVPGADGRPQLSLPD